MKSSIVTSKNGIRKRKKKAVEVTNSISVPVQMEEDSYLFFCYNVKDLDKNKK